MAVDRELWWSVWWPWAVLWIATALALVVAVGVAVWAWRVRRRYLPGEVPGVPIYLDDKAVIGIYQVGRFGDAITKEVIQRVGYTKDGKIALPGLDAAAGAAHSHEVIKTYMETHEPIAVIGVLMAALESADGVVHVDLRRLTLRRNTALEQHLRSLDGPPISARLRWIDSYVSVKGTFRMDSERDGTTVFLAAFGAQDNPEEGPQMRIACNSAGLRDELVPEGAFNARCLGRVQAWKAEEGHLVIRPIAMFQ
ncbi:hypothetical protein [Saccharothrix deserti]|uniref:hypothetical protein n=1 Tax=Saccharothrix deserti TaxID=2593674 RepID=UPI00131D782F|nr:hypothetical protein [Saccharothrix deserti]